MSRTDKILDAMRVDRKRKLKLSKCKTDAADGVKDKDDAREQLAEATARLSDLQHKLYAESKRALLVIFQAMDTAGKDGVVRKVFGPVNPQGARVNSFKRPTPAELAHDYLWRVHRVVPEKGMIGVFNRSHYEDVLVHRVHRLLSEDVIERRYRQINDFEKYLTENGVVIVKFFLHISRDEQKKRLQARLDNPKKRWKFETGDLAERKLWDKYQDAYQAVLDNCAFDHAPWYVVPSDNKWYRDWVVSNVLVDALKKIDPEYPAEEKGLDAVKIE